MHGFASLCGGRVRKILTIKVNLSTLNLPSRAFFCLVTFFLTVRFLLWIILSLFIVLEAIYIQKGWHFDHSKYQ